MGEKFGRDSTWEGHLATEIWQARIDLEAVLHEQRMPLRNVLNLKVGDTIFFDQKSEPLISVRCGDQIITEAAWAASAIISRCRS